MNTKKFDIHWTATKAEIRHWMQKESERMGNWLDTFVISWAYIGDEEIYRLELCSEASMKLVRRAQAEGRLRDCRFGTILCLAYIRDNTGECLPTIKAEGDTLYYALRKDFHIKRIWAIHKERPCFFRMAAFFIVTQIQVHRKTGECLQISTQ